MKRIIAVIGSLIVAFIICYLVYFIGKERDFSFQSFGMFVIIPIGSLLIGAGTAGSYSLILKFFNQKILNIDYLIAVFLGIFSWFLIYNLHYSSIGIIEKGEDISIVYDTTNVDYKLSDALSFGEYINLIASNRTISFFYKVPTISIGNVQNNILGWIDFIIELLGYIVGALGMIAIISNTTYCEKCKRYYKKEKRANINVIKAKGIIKDLEGKIKKGATIKDFLVSIGKENEKHLNASDKISVTFSKNSCPICGDGMLIIEFMTYNSSKSEWVHVDKLDQYVAMSHDKVLGGSGSLQSVEYIIDALLKEIKE